MPAERQNPDPVAEQHQPEQHRLHRLGPGEGIADREVAQREQMEQQQRRPDLRHRADRAPRATKARFGAGSPSRSASTATSSTAQGAAKRKRA